MSKLSKYYRVTKLLLVEYIAESNPKLTSAVSTDYYIYTGLDNKTYYTEELHNKLKNQIYSNQGLYLRIPDESDSEYLYPGIKKLHNIVNPEGTVVNDVLKDLLASGNITHYSENKTMMVYDKIRIHLIYGFTLDKLTGFNLQLSVLCSTLKPKLKTSGNVKLFDANNNPIFETLSVGTYISDYENVGNKEIELELLVNSTEDIVLLDMYFPKELLLNAVKWHTSSLYQNGSFYDRYIEIDVPSAQYIAINPIIKLQAVNAYGYKPVSDDILYLTSANNQADSIIYNIPDYSSIKGTELKYAIATKNNDERLIHYTIPENPEIIIGFSTVSEGHSESLELNTKTRSTSIDTFYKLTFYQDPIDLIAIQYKSNSDLFNVRIYEDTKNNQIVYYPVYGESGEIQDLDIEVMNEIETGSIPMVSKGFYNTLDDMYEFYEMYGENARQWIIYNDMSVNYNYGPMIEKLDASELTTWTTSEKFTNIIDYTDKTYQDGQFWRSTYIPKITSYTNYKINSITVSYTCRLVNRLTSIECIRTATLLIENPEKYVTKRVALNNVVTYKVVNKIQNHELVTKTVETKANDKYIRSYYDATNIVISNTGNSNVYMLGEMILRLKRTGTNYMFRLYEMNEDNIRIPYDLTGPYDYKLVFPTNEGNKIIISPNIDSQDTQMGLGLIVFYITEEQVKRIMAVPDNDRYFAIILDYDKAQSSTLYEGHVNYFNS